MNKKELRAKYDQKRKELSTEEIENRSRAIANQFSSVRMTGVRYLHTFYPMAGRHEMNSLLLAEAVRQRSPSTALVLPKSDLVNCTLTHILWTDDTPLAMNSWGITEPARGTEIAPADIDMVIIPLLAFDRRGHRLGYGKGFYDRFLSQCRPDVIKIGVSFFPPENIIQTEEHDIPLDLCITPEKIWEFNHRL